MATSRAWDVTKAVAALIEASEALVYVRVSAEPALQLAEMGSINWVTVLPSRLRWAWLTRETREYTIDVEVGLQRKIKAGTSLESQVETAVALLEELGVLLDSSSLPELPAATCTGVELRILASPEDLNARVYTGVLVATYRWLG